MLSGNGKESIAGLVIAGGRARRMGADKPFVRFRDGCLLDAVIGRVQPQVEHLMLNLRPDQVSTGSRAEEFRMIHDAFGGEMGPLGAVVAGLQELPLIGAQWLATFPCDTPFLPHNMVASLFAAAHANLPRPAVAMAFGKVQSLCALWPLASLGPLRDIIAPGALRSVWRVLDKLGGLRIDIPCEPHAFFNVNTPEDLIEAETLADGDRKISWHNSQDQ
jgi:molybdopterin-guanine dinucleotide biosynthesis protein A